MARSEVVKFESTLETTDSVPVWHILRVPKEKVAHFGFKGNLRRVVCTLDRSETIHCSLFPSKGNYFITLNKKLRERLNIVAGDTVTIRISKDESEYGMPMPEEFEEVLRQDPAGAELFYELSPGNQRMMLKLIVFVKDPDRRIARALAGIETLKRSNGEFQYYDQKIAMKIATWPDLSFGQ